MHAYYISNPDFISIGWESPAGQAYASTSDLGKLMSLMFSTDKPYNLPEEQVRYTVYYQHSCIVFAFLRQCCAFSTKLSPLQISMVTNFRIAIGILSIYIRFHSAQILDGETIREWTAPAFMYPDGTGFSFPWELVPLGNYTLRTKDGAINGYRAEFQMAVGCNSIL